MEFLIICRDGPDGLAIRQKTRPDHLAYLEAKGSQVRLAGPMLDKDGNPAGSLLVVETDDIAAARALADADPYARAGLFAEVSVVPFRSVLGSLLTKS